MKTRIENETVKPAGITYPALFKSESHGSVWLRNADGSGMLIHRGDDPRPLGHLIRPGGLWFMDTHIPGPITITFNSDKE